MSTYAAGRFIGSAFNVIGAICGACLALGVMLLMLFAFGPLVFLVWLLFGVIAWIAGMAKGMNGWAAFFLGIGLGIFGFVIVLCLPRNQVEMERKALASGAQKQCQYCGELVRRQAVKCRWCGERI